MRTTITLDDDVAVWIQKLAAKRKARPRDIINEALRQGLHTLEQPKKKKGEYKIQTSDVGRCLIENIDNIGEILPIVEGDDYK